LLGWEYDKAQTIISTGKFPNMNFKQLRNGGIDPQVEFLFTKVEKTNT